MWRDPRGSHTGQERDLYDKLGLNVIWIEPIPHVFSKLQANLAPYPKQRAIRALVTDQDDAEKQFHVANNDGASSSILELKDHKDIWPEVGYTEALTLKTITLTSLFEREQINPDSYQALVMDTQGSELLVLRGSIPILQCFRYVKTEVPDFESYANCRQLPEMENFMSEHGFSELSRHKFASRPQGGSYFDIVYQNTRKRHR
ncbi:MAG: FkbM family methyltransferase [Steroidobacteraceae bacterium]